MISSYHTDQHQSDYHHDDHKLQEQQKYQSNNMSLKNDKRVHSLTGNIISSSTETLSTKDINIPLFEKQYSVGLSGKVENELDPVVETSETNQDKHIEGRDGHHSVTADTHTSHPMIMPRPLFTINRDVSIRREVFPSSRYNNFSAKSSLSAFSPPGFPQTNVSPVPSIITSDCSDMGSSSCVHGSTYGDNSSDYYQDWHPSGKATNIYEQSLLSSSFSQFSKPYYFTPMDAKKEPNSSCHGFDKDSEKAIKNIECDLPQRSFPQCMNVRQSMIDQDYHHRQKDYRMEHQRSVYPIASMSYNQRLYCEPVINAATRKDSQVASSKNRHQNNKATLLRPNQSYVMESPTRLRKKSVDSADSNITSKNPSEDECSSPLPQNLKGDPHRQAKVKTELCLHYARGKECPFGSRCNYAHGEDELKYTKLFELKEAGLIDDVTTYRTHPCASWVATGSCPFGLRCNNIHDPRIASDIPSWLPHSDIPVSSLQTDLMVDKSYHHHLAALNQHNPLVQNLMWNFRPSQKKPKLEGESNHADVEWRDTYSLVCNMANLYSGKKITTTPGPSNGRIMKVNELEKLCIALHMSYDAKPIHMDYVYKPKHMVYGELCMVLQTKYYLLLRPSKVNLDQDDGKDSVVREITLKEYQGRASVWNKNYLYSPNDIVVVKELAFGCLGEAASKVSLWFDVPEPIALTNQEIKRHKRNKQKKLLDTTIPDTPSPFPGDVHMKDIQNQSFESHSLKPFFHMQPVDNDYSGFHLITSILEHRVSSLLLKKFSRHSIEARVSLSKQDKILQGRFQKLQKNIELWKWPTSNGREKICTETLVPHCSAPYQPNQQAPVSNIWNSFLSSAPIQLSDTDHDKDSMKAARHKLEVFKLLSKGKSVTSEANQILPHIKSCVHNDKVLANEAWQSIIGDDSTGGWNLIKDHYLDGTEIQTNKDANMPLSPPDK